jgi:hypothetical protein
MSESIPNTATQYLISTICTIIVSLFLCFSSNLLHKEFSDITTPGNRKMKSNKPFWLNQIFYMVVVLGAGGLALFIIARVFWDTPIVQLSLIFPINFILGPKICPIPLKKKLIIGNILCFTGSIFYAAILYLNAYFPLVSTTKSLENEAIIYCGVISCINSVLVVFSLYIKKYPNIMSRLMIFCGKSADYLDYHIGLLFSFCAGLALFSISGLLYFPMNLTIITIVLGNISLMLDSLVITFRRCHPVVVFPVIIITGQFFESIFYFILAGYSWKLLLPLPAFQVFGVFGLCLIFLGHGEIRSLSNK